MAFLALASQKSVLALQKNFLQLQYLSISNENRHAMAQMTAIERKYAQMNNALPEGAEQYDYTEDADYIYFTDLSEQLETEKDSLDSQLTAIDAEISSLKTMVQNSIKSSCTLNLASGG